MFQIGAAFLSLAALMNGLDGDTSSRRQAETFIRTEVDAVVTSERGLKAAPKRWYDCMSQIKDSKVLKREIMRLYLEEEKMRLMEPDALVRKAATDLCDEEFYRF